jgi:hypothetical protein
MNMRWFRLSLALLAAAPAARAGDGLVAPSPETLWPRWQARIAVQAASVSPLAMSSLYDSGAAQRGVQGGALFGDYYFARPAFGSFRASGGLVSGALGGLPLASALAGPLLGLSLSGTTPAQVAVSLDSPGTLPYVGLGFTGEPWHNGLAITADLGLVAERLSAAAGVGRALFGSQGMDNALREMRLSPVLQLGLRYSF